MAGPEGAEGENYFLGAIASLAALATRNFTTVLAGILIASPISGVAAHARLAVGLHQTAQSRDDEYTVLFLALLDQRLRASPSRNAAACLLLTSFFSAMWRTRAGSW